MNGNSSGKDTEMLFLLSSSLQQTDYGKTVWLVVREPWIFLLAKNGNKQFVFLYSLQRMLNMLPCSMCSVMIYWKCMINTHRANKLQQKYIASLHLFWLRSWPPRCGDESELETLGCSTSVQIYPSPMVRNLWHQHWSRKVWHCTDKHCKLGHPSVEAKLLPAVFLRINLEIIHITNICR